MIKQKGVTLIEMLIAVAIIGILTAVAYPSFQSYLLKGHRTQAMADLIMIQLAIENKRTEGKNYSDFNGIEHSQIINSLCPACANDERYDYDITATTIDYTIKASPKLAQTNDECAVLSIDQTSKGLPSECW